MVKVIMPAMTVWHEDPLFWDAIGEWLFTPRRMASATSCDVWIIWLA